MKIGALFVTKYGDVFLVTEINNENVIFKCIEQNTVSYYPKDEIFTCVENDFTITVRPIEMYNIIEFKKKLKYKLHLKRLKMDIDKYNEDIKILTDNIEKAKKDIEIYNEKVKQA